MSSRTDRHVVVVKGGHSVERQVSLVSGRDVRLLCVVWDIK